jgi:2OG-Fe(II) oxygenase superfamily
VSCFDLDRLSEPAISDLTSRYREAVPFAHVVLDDFVLVAPGDIDAAFPGPEWEHWVDRSSDHQPTKSSCRKVELMPPILRDMVHELSEPRFLRALIALSGFKNLLPDPYLHGGGLQRWGKGGEQIPHTDFPFHPTAPLCRRVNVLVYLNPDWTEGDGGELSFYGVGNEEPTVSISPKFGTCVIFNTDPWSVHSVRPVSDSSAARRTIGLYYFTAEADDVITRERWPKWYEEGSLSATSPVDKARLAGTKTALGASRAFARLANKMDPRRPSR